MTVCYKLEVHRSVTLIPSHRRYLLSTALSRSIQRVDLFGAEPLGIFTDRSSKSADGSSTLPVWEALHEEELQRSVSHPPDNAFVEMIQWTNQGKLWTFPIDNEFGKEIKFWLWVEPF